MPKNPAQYVIHVFGGVRATARALGLGKSAISRWNKRGLIPSTAQKLVLEKAQEKGLDLSCRDLVLGRVSRRRDVKNTSAAVESEE
jgi:hypothetical protein